MLPGHQETWARIIRVLKRMKAKDPLKITKLETFLVKPRWVFLKIHTNAGITGLGEPLLEGRALTIQTAIKANRPYLVEVPVDRDIRPIGTGSWDRPPLPNPEPNFLKALAARGISL